MDKEFGGGLAGIAALAQEGKGDAVVAGDEGSIDGLEMDGLGGPVWKDSGRDLVGVFPRDTDAGHRSADGGDRGDDWGKVHGAGLRERLPTGHRANLARELTKIRPHREKARVTDMMM